MKKVAKAMYGKSMMKKGGIKKYQSGGDTMYTNTTAGEITPMKKGGSTKKYQAGGIKKASGMKKATTMNPTSRNTAMTELGVDKKNQYSPSKFNDNVTSYARGTGAKKMKGGGRVISEKAAARKSAKGKGFTSSIMGANPSGDKGQYVPFTRQGRKDAKETGRVSSKEMKSSRQIMKMGGAKKK